jgi:hypothetical protein
MFESTDELRQHLGATSGSAKDVVYVVEHGDVSYSEILWIGRDEQVARDKAKADSVGYPYESWVRRWTVDSDEDQLIVTYKLGEQA